MNVRPIIIMSKWRLLCICHVWAVTTIGVSHAWLISWQPRLVHGSLVVPRHLAAGNNPNNKKVDKGFNLLEIASQVVPQGRIVQTAKESWRFLWQRFMVELAPQDPTGAYQRPTYTFGNTLGSTKYPLNDIFLDNNNNNGRGDKQLRYHLYLGNPCPWCHRVKLVVNILNLYDVVGVTQLVDDPIKASRGGWVFDQPPPQASSSSPIQDLRQLYQFMEPGYQGRCTAPLLVDWKTKTIVSNESKELVRMLPLLQQAQTPANQNQDIDLCPASLQTQIDETNEWIYQCINNGVYQCGFATTQEAYDRASSLVLQGLERCEAILQNQPYLCGNQLTESDVFLLPTMLRFDAVYAPLFGAGGLRHWRLQVDFPHVHDWMKRCWQHIPGVSTSIDLQDASQSYYKQLFPLNPGGILPSLPISPQRLGLEKV